jgi:hypothetical protein
MTSSKAFRAILGLSLGAMLFASTAQAQPEDRRTYFTFSGPVALPGVTLAAGRYVFRIVDTTTSRKVIQVLSDDEKRPFAMMNTITDTRRDPAKDATVSFYESPRGTPAAVKSWWYPGETDGYQFIYPRAQAKQIAHNTGKPVLTTKTEDTKSAVTQVDPEGKNVEGFHDPSANATVFNRNAPAITEGRTPPQAAQAEPAPVPTESSRVARNELPRTASNLPLVGLIGMLSALAFVTLRFSTSLRS